MSKESVAQTVAERLRVDEKTAGLIIEKAIAGGETDDASLGAWLEQRFLPNIVSIDKDGYARMCIDALKILDTTAATDFGGSRQRDLGQLWADMTRGYVGELAFQHFLAAYGIDAELGHEAGALEDYLPGDIRTVRKRGETARPPKKQIGLKTTKWNGIWFDIPGDQFNHSDAHVLMKIGGGRDHLFSFFKDIGVFSDMILPLGKRIGLLSDVEVGAILGKIPDWKPISAYVAGFVLRDAPYADLPYAGTKGRKHFTIAGWNGKMSAGDLARIKEREGITGEAKFLGIGSFSHENGHLFNTGNLKWTPKDWQGLIDSL